MLKILQCFRFLTCSSHEYLHIIHLSSTHIEKSLLSYIYPFLPKQIRFNNNNKKPFSTNIRSVHLSTFSPKKTAMAKSSLGNLVLCLALLVALRCFSTTFVGPSTPTKTPWQQRRVALRSAEEEGQVFLGCEGGKWRHSTHKNLTNPHLTGGE